MRKHLVPKTPEWKPGRAAPRRCLHTRQLCCSCQALPASASSHGSTLLDRAGVHPWLGPWAGTPPLWAKINFLGASDLQLTTLARMPLSEPFAEGLCRVARGFKDKPSLQRRIEILTLVKSMENIQAT